MALPRRLFIPEGVQDLPAAVPARTFQAGPWAGATSPAEPLVGAAATTALLGPARRRRRAMLPGEGGLPDRPMLVEWFPSDELDEQAASEVKGLCHVHLLRLHLCGLADTRTAFALSEAPLGVDLQTVLRASKEALPAWWSVRVGIAAARGLLALHRHLQGRGPGRGHGGVSLGALFVSGSGMVQLLSFVPQRRSLQQQGVSDEVLAPELLASPRLLSPAADVFALGAVLRELLPASARGRGALGRLLGRCLSSHPEQRPALSAVVPALEAILAELGRTGAAGSEDGGGAVLRAAALGEIVVKRCPPAPDFAEAEAGDSVTPGFPTLTRSLRTLSSPALASSGTWALAAEEQAPEQRPRPRRSRGRIAATAATAALVVSAGLGALVAGAIAVRLEPGSRAATASDAAAVLPGAVALSGSGGTPQALSDPGGLPLRVGASAASVSLRVRVAAVTGGQADRLRLQLRLSNLTSQRQVVELGGLRLVAPGTEAEAGPLAPVSGEAGPGAVEIGAGREQIVAVEFVVPAGPARAGLRLRWPAGP